MVSSTLWHWIALVFAIIKSAVPAMMIFTWAQYYNHLGLSSHNGNAPFWWHPLCMTFAMVCLMPTAALMWRLPEVSYKVRQWLHVILHTLAFGVVIVGLWAMERWKVDFKPKPIKHFYSAHAYMGLFVIVLHQLLYWLSLIVFVVCRLHPDLDAATARLRLWMLPYHRMFGRLLLFTGAAVSIMGIMNEEGNDFARDKITKHHSVYDARYMMVNMITIMITISTYVVYFHLQRPRGVAERVYTAVAERKHRTQWLR